MDGDDRGLTPSASALASACSRLAFVAATAGPVAAPNSGKRARVRPRADWGSASSDARARDSKVFSDSPRSADRAFACRMSAVSNMTVVRIKAYLHIDAALARPVVRQPAG